MASLMTGCQAPSRSQGGASGVHFENLHGYDWDDLLYRYRPLLAHVGHRSDLNYLIGEMTSELSVSLRAMKFPAALLTRPSSGRSRQIISNISAIASG